MKSLVELQNEIQALQQQATELRSREFDRTVADIVAQMAAFGISLAQLKAAMRQAPGRTNGKGKGRARTAGRPPARAGKARAKAKGKASRAKARTAQGGQGKAAKAGAPRGPAKIKFRGPGGESWSGRGKTPTWLRALVDAGRPADEFRV